MAAGHFLIHTIMKRITQAQPEKERGRELSHYDGECVKKKRNENYATISIKLRDILYAMVDTKKGYYYVKYKNYMIKMPEY